MKQIRCTITCILSMEVSTDFVKIAVFGLDYMTPRMKMRKMSSIFSSEHLGHKVP